MATPLPTGTISLSDVDVYLGSPGTQLISLNDTAVRALAAVPTGTIAMSNLQGKPGALFTLTIATDQANYNVRTRALAAGWNGTDPVVVNINSGVKVYSASIGSYAMTVTGGFPNTLVINNNGYILGQGGSGAPGSSYSTSDPGSPGGAGGPALNVESFFTLNNQGVIGSGGGGGGAGGSYDSSSPKATVQYGAGGGGGGRTGPAPAPGGVGIGGASGSGSPGGDGTFAALGAAGGGSGFATPGGAGGTWGSNGSPGVRNSNASTGGSGGGATGTAINGYGLINLTGSGTIYGPTSAGDETLLTIASPVTSGFDINAQATAAGWNGTRRVRVVVNPGVSVVSGSVGSPAMSATGAFPNSLVIINNGYIVGKGGTGGDTVSGNASGNPGTTGGTGLYIANTTSNIFLANNSTIAGGGGGGGSGGGGGYTRIGLPSILYGSGGGGGGAGLGAAGSSGASPLASPGSATAGGAGGSNNFSAGGGGTGGGMGSVGGIGVTGLWDNTTATPGGAGGPAGYAVYGTELITYVVTGTILGTRQGTIAQATISSPTANLNVRTAMLAAGWNGTAQAQLTIAPGVSVSSSSAGTPAVTISGAFPGGIALVNNGTIAGAGGNGGGGGGWGPQSGKSPALTPIPAGAGVGGGTALYVTVANTSVTNNGTIAGGGGGGAGGAPYITVAKANFYNGGNGGGGGAGVITGSGGGGGNGGDTLVGPEARGTPGSSGSPGTATAGGTGAGSGGSRGSAGGTSGAPGGGAGAAVVGSSNIVWVTTGTRIGPLA